LILIYIILNLGLCSDGDEVVFARRRAVELKHGRVAMLAVAGYVVAEIARFPGAIDLDGLQFKDIPNGLAAITAIPGEINRHICIYRCRYLETTI
jgi:hypothetical protein